MANQYRIAIDHNHDGKFDDAKGEISSRVIELRWRLGLREAYESMAAPGWARITALNADGAFSPERSPLQSGTRLRIQSDYAGFTRTHFTGSISHIELDEGEHSDKRALIHAQDIQPWLADSPARLSPQIDVRADQVIARLLAGASLRRPQLRGFCLIDVEGYNQIDATRIFPAENVARRLQPGKSRFAFVGDWWRDSISTLEAIGEIAASERGRFYIDRDGAAVFLNRHHTLIQRKIVAEFHDDMTGMAYSYGDQRLNQIALLMTPREVGASDTLLWQLRSPLRLGRRSDLLLHLRLIDERDQPIGLLELERLATRFQLGPEGGGRAVDSGAFAEVAQLGTTSIQLRLVNQTRNELYLTLLQLYGKPLFRRDPLEIAAEDGEGMHIYGLRRLALDLPALSDIESARAFADYELARRKHPRGSIHRLQINAREHMPAALSARLFERIRVSEAQTGHDAREYLIVGEEHHVSAGGASHELTWTLEPADSARFVIINNSRINSKAEVIAPY